jgi:hypothetical protein
LQHATISLRAQTDTLSDTGSECTRFRFGCLAGLGFENGLEFGLQRTPMVRCARFELLNNGGIEITNYDNSMTLALRRVALPDRDVYTAARLVR